MKNLHLLPTDKPTRLHNTFNTLRLEKGYDLSPSNLNIYITSNEEIKEGDCFLSKEEIVHNNWGWNFGDKKIILTTDQDLIKDGVQAIDDEFLEWFVKNPSCEWVETKVEFIQTPDNLKDGFYYKIIIPNKALTYIEEAAEIYANSFGYNEETLQQQLAAEYGFIAGAKFQQSSQMNWIKIEDRKPKQGQLVLVKGGYFLLDNNIREKSELALVEIQPYGKCGRVIPYNEEYNFLLSFNEWCEV